MNIRKQLLHAGMLAAMSLASVNAGAVVFNDFTIDPDGADSSNTTNAAPFVADKITGNYVEVVTFTATSATTGTFDTSIKWNAGQFVANDGATSLIANVTQLGSDYGLYAVLQGSGTYNTVGAVTTFDFDHSGSLNVYSDSDLDTILTAPATGNLAWTGTDADDILLATGAVLNGAGTLDPGLTTCNPGINCGSFGVTTSFGLTPAGENFFIDPVPFYNLAFDSGQFNNFTVAGTQTINGSLDVVFAVPEPSSIALMGLAMLGLGAASRRKQA